MPTQDSSFDQLLSRAPAAPNADIVTVVGALARSTQEGKFVLTVPDGRSLTFDVAAVKQYRVVAESLGQLLVELDLDAKEIPAEERLEPVTYAPTINPYQTATYPSADFGSHVADVPPPFNTIYTYDIQTPYHIDQHQIAFGGEPYAGFTPFLMAAVHQAPAATMAALEAFSMLHPKYFPKVKADRTSPRDA
jgi:hypothetical protein